MVDKITISSRGRKGWDEDDIREQFKILTLKIRYQSDLESVGELAEQGARLVDSVSLQNRKVAMERTNEEGRET